MVPTLLGSIDSPAPEPASLLDSAELKLENKLVQVRLGVASSLFAALRAKHAPTAHHSLRVALVYGPVASGSACAGRSSNGM